MSPARPLPPPPPLVHLYSSFPPLSLVSLLPVTCVGSSCLFHACPSFLALYFPSFLSSGDLQLIFCCMYTDQGTGRIKCRIFTEGELDITFFSFHCLLSLTYTIHGDFWGGSIETLAKVSTKFPATNQKCGVKFSGSVGRHYEALESRC